jgi:hypothetical protein
VTIDVVRYQPALHEEWDVFCANAANSTFLHTRRFLGYHGDRFRDVSAVLMQDGDIVGVFPAAEAPADRSIQALPTAASSTAVPCAVAG